MTLVLAGVVGTLFAVGTYLLLQRSLTRIVLGIAVLGHGANLLLLLAGGPAGAPPLVGEEAAVAPADPLPQALALTAVVISFGTIAFLLALAWRSWALHREDRVPDDLEDARIAAGGRSHAEDEEVADLHRDAERRAAQQ